jgi:hypothetical protein
MIDLGGLPPVAEAAALVGIVLVGAMILYVVYGAVEQLLASAVIERIRNN